MNLLVVVATAAAVGHAARQLSLPIYPSLRDYCRRRYRIALNSRFIRRSAHYHNGGTPIASACRSVIVCDLWSMVILLLLLLLLLLLFYTLGTI